MINYTCPGCFSFLLESDVQPNSSGHFGFLRYVFFLIKKKKLNLYFFLIIVLKYSLFLTYEVVYKYFLVLQTLAFSQWITLRAYYLERSWSYFIAHTYCLDSPYFFRLKVKSNIKLIWFVFFLVNFT